MRKHRQRITFILLFLLAGILLIFLTYAFPPNYQIPIPFLKIPIVIPIFIIIYVLLFGFAGICTNTKTQATIIATTAITYLALRYLGVTHWFFTILLFILFIFAELVVYQNNDRRS